MNSSRESIDKISTSSANFDMETKESCLQTIKNMDSIDYFAEQGPRSRCKCLKLIIYSFYLS